MRILGVMWGLCLLSFVVHQNASAAEVKVLRNQEAIDALQFLADQVKANSDAIRTWQGVYAYRQESKLGGTHARFVVNQASSVPKRQPVLTQKNQGQIAFVYGAAEASFYSCCKDAGPPQIIDMRTGVELPFEDRVGTLECHVVVTPARFLHFFPNVSHAADAKESSGTSAAGRMAIRDELSAAQGRQWANILDPRLLFTFHPNVPLERWLAAFPIAYAKAPPEIKDSYHRSIVVTRRETSGNVVYELVWSPHDIWRLRFESQADYLLTHCIHEKPAGKKLIEQTWKFEKRDGVSIPIEIERNEWDADDESPRYHRTLTLIDSTLNQPLDKSIFTWKAFGLKEGERYFDRVENKRYVVADEELVELAD